MASLFWVGGTGTYDGTTNHFATTSGGTATVAAPTSSDTVTFDTLSNATAYTVTISATLTCSDLTIGNPLVGAITFAGSSALNIFGNFSLASGMTRTYTGAITFSATGTGKTLTFNSITTASVTIFNGVGGGWTLQDAWNNGTSNITLTNGTLDTNGKTVTCGGFNSSNGNTRTLTLGASTINSQGFTFTNTTNLTFNANTSTLNQTAGNPFSGGGLTFNNVEFQALQTSSISGANTFANLTITGQSVKTNVLSVAANQTVSGVFTANGNSSINRILIQTDTTGTTRTITAATVTVTNADFMDITGAGAGSWNLSAISGGSGDCGGNSGITFTTGANQYYKIGASANWSTTANWYLGTNGTGGAGRVPLPQDTAIFDANSITAGSVTITQDMPRIGSVNWTGVTNTPTWTTSTAASVFGSITLISGMTLTASTQTYTFGGRGSYTLTSAGKTWAKAITVNAPGGTLTLGDSFTQTATTITFTVTAGTFDAADFNFSVDKFWSTGSTTRVINMGTGTCTVTGVGTASGTPWNFTATSITFNPEGGTIKFTNTGATAIEFIGGGLTYSNIWFSRGSSNATTTIVGSNTFLDFKDDGSVAHSILFTAGTTTTVTTFTVNGSVGQEITINSTTTATHALVKTGGGTISCDYLNIQHSVATPTLTWLATNSTNNQATATAGSGWYFGSFPGGSTNSNFFAFL